MKVSVSVACPVKSTFRVKQLSGMFDVPPTKKSERSWNVELPDLEEPWQIGAIVGPSGSGKTTIARKAYGKDFCASFQWPQESSVLDGFDEETSIRDITGILSSVGFASPPDWLKPYRVLSNGQRFRADLARALLTPAEVMVYDEFTSVVDRQVAQFGSAAGSKTIRKGRTAAFAKRFVVVSCHYDILPWLQPDWVLDLGASASGQLARRWLQQGTDRDYFRRIGERPRIDLEIRRVSKAMWGLFRAHHYLSASLLKSAHRYVAFWNDRPIAFCGIIPQYGAVHQWRISRVVTLPDFQGMGIGNALTNFVAERYRLAGNRVTIRAAHPAIVASYARSALWRCISRRLCQTAPTGLAAREMKATSAGRATASFEYIGLAAPATVGTVSAERLALKKTK